jgi:hypothetical protein
MTFRITLIAAATFSVTAALAQTQPVTLPSTREVASTAPSTQSAVAATQPKPTAQTPPPEEKRDIPPALAAALKARAAELATKPSPLVVSDGKFRDTYQIVVDRNIFTRTHYLRSDSSDARRLSDLERAQRRQILVLTGVVEEGRQLVAFIENTRTGETERHAAGDSLVQGKVLKIDFDAILYDNAAGGQPIRVEVGMNLDGRLPDFGSSSYSSYSSGRSSGNNSSSSGNSAGATTAPAATPSEPAPPGSAGDIAERLRQRRLQETKQGAGQ